MRKKHIILFSLHSAKSKRGNVRFQVSGFRFQEFNADDAENAEKKITDFGNLFATC